MVIPDGHERAMEFVEAVVDRERVDHERNIDDECNGSLIRKKNCAHVCCDGKKFD